MNIFLRYFRGRHEIATPNNEIELELNFWGGIHTQVLHCKYLVQYTALVSAGSLGRLNSPFRMRHQMQHNQRGQR